MRRDYIGNAYNSAIGQTYSDFAHAFGMPKTKRSVLDRAMEALAERYPREKPTQARLAALAGVKQPSVNDWRDGFPAMDTAVRLAENLDVCVEWLLTERGTKRPARPSESEIRLARLLADLDENKRRELVRFADFIKGGD